MPAFKLIASLFLVGCLPSLPAVSASITLSSPGATADTPNFVDIGGDGAPPEAAHPRQAAPLSKPGVIRLGVREVQAGDQIFRTINGRDVTITITPTGLVKLSFPETRPSNSGGNQTRAWVMNSYMIPLIPAEREALATTGLRLPEGAYTFYVYYIDPKKTTTVDQLRGNWWEIMMNPETYRNYTADAEYALLEIPGSNAQDDRRDQVTSRH